MFPLEFRGKVNHDSWGAPSPPGYAYDTDDLFYYVDLDCISSANHRYIYRETNTCYIAY